MGGRGGGWVGAWVEKYGIRLSWLGTLSRVPLVQSWAIQSYLRVARVALGDPQMVLFEETCFFSGCRSPHRRVVFFVVLLFVRSFAVVSASCSVRFCVCPPFWSYNGILASSSFRMYSSDFSDSGSFCRGGRGWTSGEALSTLDAGTGA